MKRALTRDLPRRALVTVLALVASASAVRGTEDSRSQEQPEAAVGPTLRAAAPVEPPASVAADIALDKLSRPRKAETIPDLFASRPKAPQAPVLVAAAKIPPAPPPAPVAPALPFRYLGRMIDGDQAVVFLAKGDQHYSARRGDTLEDTYRVDELSESTVTMIYLPLETKQILAIPPAP